MRGALGGRDSSGQFAERYLSGFRGMPTPTQLPLDPTERAQLRAYAEYGLVVLLALEGRTDEAGIAYSELSEEYVESSPGYTYAELASAFWEGLEASSDLHVACERATEYASLNPEIMEPLGSDYHGWQSHRYVPADICPFE